MWYFLSWNGWGIGSLGVKAAEVRKFTAIAELRQHKVLVRSVLGWWSSTDGQHCFSNQAIMSMVRKGKARITETRRPSASEYGWCAVPCRVELCERKEGTT